MPKKQQANKNQLIQIQKMETLHPIPEGILRTFSNPVCKQTYYSLPKIYGKKKKKQKDTDDSKQSRARLQQQITKTRNYFSSNDTQSHSRDKKIKLKIISNHTKSQLHCKKSNCSYHIHQKQLFQQKTKKKPTSAFGRPMLFPQVRKFQLQDLESQHKVTQQGFSTRINFRKTGLEKIIEQNQKIKSINDSKQDSPRNQKNQRKGNNISDSLKQINIGKGNLNILKNKHKTKPRINNPKFQIQQQSDQQRRTDEMKQKVHGEKNHKIKDQTARFQTEPNDSSQSKSSHSISLNSLLFSGAKSQNTKFYELNLSQRSMERKMSRKPSQLSNGLFRIPQQEQYEDYIRDYKNVNQNFDIFQIAKRPGFKVQKSDKGVYFGEFDNELRKHGEGINVSQKQIFEGKYERDIKSSGSERNIDGVYVGEFKNGRRQGHGIFKWNNGQIFQGKWQNGVKNGFGKWKSPKGDSYEGQWFQNRQHGKGIFKHRTSAYNGEFKNFLKDGFGLENFANGDRYEGEYKGGKPHGKGRYQWNGGGYYDGQFRNGMREGRGKWVDQNNTTYQGFFKSDFKHGHGKQKYISGQIFEGQFNQGVRTVGKLFDKNHNVIQIDQK